MEVVYLKILVLFISFFTFILAQPLQDQNRTQSVSKAQAVQEPLPHINTIPGSYIYTNSALPIHTIPASFINTAPALPINTIPVSSIYTNPAPTYYTTPVVSINTEKIVQTNDIISKVNDTKSNAPEPNFIIKIFRAIKAFFVTPKVSTVLRNIGVCVVNGAMDIITYYIPAPLIPLVTSAVGQVIPFEPLLLLRDSMPVNNYRRAFLTAIRSFLGTFDRYKTEDPYGPYNDEDPYMLNRFNRRMMSYGSGEKKKPVVQKL